MNDEEKKLIAMEIAGNEAEYTEHFKKTFITENKKKDGGAWTLHGLRIPQGSDALLVRVPDLFHDDLNVSEIADRLYYTEPTQVVLLAGARKTERQV